MTRRIAFILLITLLLLGGCASAKATSAPAPMPMAAPAMDAAPMEKESFARESASYDAAGSAASANESDSNGDRMVIRNANLDIVVIDPSQSMSDIIRMATDMGGFVVSSNLYKYTSDGVEYPQASVTVRVPAEKLNDALDQIKAMVEDPIDDVVNESITGQDITNEYSDLESRLRNLEAAEAQLREIMASAVKTEDVLAVHNQLTQVREQIEVIRGQMQYYKEASDLSSIAVTLRAKASVQPLEIGGWKPVGVARDAAQALINALEFLGSAFIWIVIFVLPVGLLLALPFIVVALIWRRTRKNRKSKEVVPPPPPAAQ